jgi:pseudouridylate synthase
LGDTLYGGDEAEHLFLHAWRLVFDYRGEHFDIRVTPDKTWPSAIDLSACLGLDESE